LTKEKIEAFVEPADLGDLEEMLSIGIRFAHVAVYRRFMATICELGLTQKQVFVLWLVGDNPGVAQTDLAQRLFMDRATTMGIVNRLEARHFLRRGPTPADRRRKTLYLTGEGEAMLARAKESVWAHERWLGSRFTRKEARMLLELLHRIHA
jgi:DNA-binding MarR family transcriptional regulator